MKTKVLLTVAIFFATLGLKAQTNYLVIGEDIRLPKDSIERFQLTTNLNDFLLSAQKSNNENQWILPTENAETQILLSEMQGIEKSDSIEFCPHLINLEILSDRKTYIVQVAYMGLQNKQPILRACFELLAHKTDTGFLFSSPLVRNTKDWKVKTVGHFIFHYQDTSAENVINQQAKYLTEYDKILNFSKITEYYFCDDCESMTQILQLAGIQYKLDYNSFTWSGISFNMDDKAIFIQTQRQSRQKEVDPHYSFHARAELAVPSEKSNYYMICAGANVYSGCWGMTWSEIQKMFKEKMSNDKKADWLKLYLERYNFGESKQKYIFVTTFINGLIIQKVEREQGVSGVMKLFESGDMYKDKENFFKTLESVTGINEKNFNKEVGKLISESMKKI